MAPKRSIIQISKTELFTVYIPVIQKRMTRGKRILFGILKMLAKRGTNGRLSRRRIKFPIYILAITPQKSSGCWPIIKGPGDTPWMRRAPKRMAVGGAKGIPRTNSGMKADWQAALLADSGPATPSIAPLTKLLGMF